MAVFMDCFGLTDTGRQQTSNQDHFLIGDLRKSMDIFQTSLSVDDRSRMVGGSQGKLLMVADGMGGHAAGNRASTLAIDTISDYAINSLPWLFRLEQNSDEEFVIELKTAIEKCEQSIKAEGDVIAEHEGMGTTLTLAYVIWPRVFVMHVGDSRCYLARAGNLFQVTRDHTMAQELVEEGVLSKREAKNSSANHVLWNCVGGATTDVQPHAHRAELAVGDTLLLCSDGLTKHVPDGEIETLLAESDSAQAACQSLISAANQAGGSDNITVVVARFQDPTKQQALMVEQAETGSAATVSAG